MLRFLEAKLSLPFSRLCQYSHVSSSFESQNPQFLHVFLIKQGLKFDTSLGTDLILTYFVNGEITIAQSLFKVFFENNIQLLNYRIKHLSVSGFYEKTLYLYSLLRVSNTKPDNFTFPYVLKACANLPDIYEGGSIHTDILKCGFELNIFVANSLVDMYSRMGYLLSARRVFDEMPKRNLVSWNSMISGYGLNGYPVIALELCSLMREEKGTRLDEVSMKIVLPICGQLGEIEVGKSVHAYMVKLGLSLDLVLRTAVMDMYAKCGDLDETERLFEHITFKDVVTWNAMITGYSNARKPGMVLKLFHKMRIENLAPSVVTVLITLQACSDLAVLHVGETIHGYIIRLGISSDVSVGSLLIDMYSKCGKLNSAYLVFRGISRGTVNSWSAMIYGLGMHGCGEAALMGFFEMLKRGIHPDEVCFLVILSSCSHNGLVNEGRKIFDHMMRQFRVKPKMEHYASIVDLLGRAGFIDEAFGFICQMPIEPDISVLGAFLGACRIHGKFEVGKVLGDQLVESCPKTAGYYKLLLSIYGSDGNWDEVFKIRRLMGERCVKMNSGFSLIEMNSLELS
ncbi:pentatricopeptide repeat-containing protein DOT4, chloroplastic-like [Tasmannia lanceolata]|uniref:pentatricopeptide repeat-containing protein DOT4, chloroplastic-like n=1 Tax=Tasmannia lanceolata TaxID=3420 RepID=UPI004063972E